MALTNEQARALELLRQGNSTAQAAERLGLPRPTLWRWQRELPEFAETVAAGKGEEVRAPLTLLNVVRVAMPVVALLLAALFFYLGY